MPKPLEEDEFFEKHCIEWDELEEIPLRFRDASIHYYHKKNDKVYSMYIRKEKWYISPSAEDLRFQYGYEKREEARKKIFQSRFIRNSSKLTKNLLMISSKINNIVYLSEDV